MVCPLASGHELAEWRTLRFENRKASRNYRSPSLSKRGARERAHHKFEPSNTHEKGARSS